MNRYYFTVPGELPTRNEEILAAKMHWSEEGDLKKDALELIGWSDIKKLPKLDRIKIEAVFYRKDRKSDPDNIISAIKYIIDGLQENGILENDGWKQIKGPMELDWAKDKENPRTEVKVMEVENA